MLNGMSPEITTSHRLHFAETAGAIRVDNFVCHVVNPVRHTQVKTVWGSENKDKRGSPIPTEAKDFYFHQERKAVNSLKISPEKQASPRTVQLEEAQDVEKIIKASTTPTEAKDIPQEDCIAKAKDCNAELERLLTREKSVNKQDGGRPRSLDNADP